MKIRGFTIVELLIVIVVIAILAAVSIVAYNGIQQRARDSQRKSDVAAIGKALQVWSTSTAKSPTQLGGGAGAGGAYGWFEYNYTAGSVKNVLVSAGFLNDAVREPQFQNARRDYCLWHNSTHTTWGVFAMLEAPTPSDTSTLSTLAAQSGWGSAVNGCTVGETYTPNYVQTFSMSN